MKDCYYCGKNEATTNKFNEPICESCNNADIRSSIRPVDDESDETKASRLRFWIRMFAGLKELKQ